MLRFIFAFYVSFLISVMAEVNQQVDPNIEKQLEKDVQEMEEKGYDNLEVKKELIRKFLKTGFKRDQHWVKYEIDNISFKKLLKLLDYTNVIDIGIPGSQSIGDLNSKTYVNIYTKHFTALIEGNKNFSFYDPHTLKIKKSIDIDFDYYTPLYITINRNSFHCKKDLVNSFMRKNLSLSNYYKSRNKAKWDKINANKQQIKHDYGKFPRLVNKDETAKIHTFLDRLSLLLQNNNFKKVVEEFTFIPNGENIENWVVPSYYEKSKDELLSLIKSLKNEDNWFAVSDKWYCLIRPEQEHNLQEARVIHIFIDSNNVWKFRNSYYPHQSLVNVKLN